MGFEPTNGGFADQSWIYILLVRLAFTSAHLADFGPYLGLIVPKLFPLPPTTAEQRSSQHLLTTRSRFRSTVLENPQASTC